MGSDFSCDNIDSFEMNDDFGLSLHSLSMKRWTVVDNYTWGRREFTHEIKKPEWFDLVFSRRFVEPSADQLEMNLDAFTSKHVFCNSDEYYIYILRSYQEKTVVDMICAVEREPDREVDNDVQENCRASVGDFSRENDRDRSWSDTAQDAALAAEKLWEAKQLFSGNSLTGKAIAAEKVCEAAEHAGRVLEDIGHGIVDVGEAFVESRKRAVEGGYSQNSDIGFQ